MNNPAELLDLAKRVAWFDLPEETLKTPRIFLAYLMTSGTGEDLQTSKKYFSDDAFIDVLDHPPAGVFTHHSWEHWNLIYGRTPAPPLPRRFPDSPDWEKMLFGENE